MSALFLTFQEGGVSWTLARLRPDKMGYILSAGTQGGLVSLTAFYALFGAAYLSGGPEGLVLPRAPLFASAEQVHQYGDAVADAVYAACGDSALLALPSVASQYLASYTPETPTEPEVSAAQDFSLAPVDGATSPEPS